MKLELAVDGREIALEAPPLASLLEVLRRALGAGEVARACTNGRCGACLVLVDEQPAAACLTPALHAHGHQVRTARGCAVWQQLRARQGQALPAGVAPCPTCVPAMLVVAQHLVEMREQQLSVSGEDARALLAGISCRCAHVAAQRDAMLKALGALTRAPAKRKAGKKKTAAKKTSARKTSAKKAAPKARAAKTVRRAAKAPVRNSPTRKGR